MTVRAIRPRMTGPTAEHLVDSSRASGGDDRWFACAVCSSPTPGGHRSYSAAHGWLRTGCWRESAIWRDRNTDEVRAAQREADYAFRLAVDRPREGVRLFGLADWTIDRFVTRRTRLHALQYEATGFARGRCCGVCVVIGANVAVFWSLATAAANGSLNSRRWSCSPECDGRVDESLWGPKLGARRRLGPVGAVLRLEAAMAPAGALTAGSAPGSRPATRNASARNPFRDLTFAYPGPSTSLGTGPRLTLGTSPSAALGTGPPVLDRFDLTVPAGSSLASSGRTAPQNHARKAALRLYDPQSGAIEIDGVDLRDLSLESWRDRVTAVFQDFTRFELPLRDNVAPAGAPDEMVRSALVSAGAAIWRIWTRCWPAATTVEPISREASGSASRSRARCAPCTSGRGLSCSTSPPATRRRGEAEIFDRILAATASLHDRFHLTRFSTVRLADRICVLKRAASSSSGRTTS